MKRSLDVEEADYDFAQQLNDEVLRNPASPYAGKYVAVSNGRVVATGDSYEEAIEAWDRVGEEAPSGLVFEAGVDYQKPQEIWRV